jgi:uncharacterized protein (TIGR03435 family)
MMNERAMCMPGSRRRMLSGLVSIAAALLMAVSGQPFVPLASAQAAPATPAQSIVDTWQGTLHAPGGKDLRTVLKITTGDKGELKVIFYTIDQTGQPFPTTSASFQDKVLKYAISGFDLTYEGKMSADGKSITGTSKQGDNSIPLVFERATPETAWSIPEPPVAIPPMAADADPSFEVATVKPAKPEEQGRAFLVRGRKFSTINTPLTALITFAYGLQEKQIVGGPDWMTTDKWDIEAQPDAPGTPNDKQLKSMLQKLLADRFQLKFHQDKKEMSAYVLEVTKTGSKMTKNDSNPDGLPGLFFQGLGVLGVRNATMADFSQLMQSAVLDRPVVDHTALAGRYDFKLKWTPDESQFGGMGIKVPPPSDAADAPPTLFTALQEQLGLKMDVEKTPVPVYVLDHVEKPSAN